MRTLMTGPAWVAYGQIYVECRGHTDELADLTDCFGGQRNGLCGAAVTGKLFLITGLHTGSVDFAIELHAQEPPLDDGWEDVVEASFAAAGETALVGWGGEGYWPLDLRPGDYRVRYCGWGMDAGHQSGPPMDGEPLVDRYLLQFWPAPPSPDRIVKQTSAQAAYWHDAIRDYPPPPTHEQRVEAKRQAELEQERRSAELRLAEETRRWGGTLPSERLRKLGWTAIAVAERDRPLLEAIENLDPGTQRAIARWAARRAFAEAQLTHLEWVATALQAMDAGDPLPELFEDPGRVFDRAMNDDRVVHTVITTLDGRITNFSQQSMAIPALSAAYKPDPLEAAVESIRIASDTFGFGRAPDFLIELRNAFPALQR